MAQVFDKWQNYPIRIGSITLFKFTLRCTSFSRLGNWKVSYNLQCFTVTVGEEVVMRRFWGSLNEIILPYIFLFCASAGVMPDNTYV